MQNSEKLQIYPIYGDALNLTDFGGYKVVYAWMKDAPPEVHDHTLHLFTLDKSAIYFITHDKRPESDMIPDDIEKRGNFT